MFCWPQMALRPGFYVSVFPKIYFIQFLPLRRLDFYIFWSFGTIGFNTFIWEQSCTQPGPEWHESCCICYYLSWRDSINRVCCFQTLDAVFPKDLLSDYFDNKLHAKLKLDKTHWQWNAKILPLLNILMPFHIQVFIQLLFSVNVFRIIFIRLYNCKSVAHFYRTF